MYLNAFWVTVFFMDWFKAADLYINYKKIFGNTCIGVLRWDQVFGGDDLWTHGELHHLASHATYSNVCIIKVWIVDISIDTNS